MAKSKKKVGPESNEVVQAPTSSPAVQAKDPSEPTPEQAPLVSKTTVEAHSNDSQNGDEGIEEVWDLIKIVQPPSELICRMDGCNSKAVAVWKSNLDAPEDVWPICKSCQEKEFGGWPEDVTPPGKEVPPAASDDGKEVSDTPAAVDSAVEDEPPEETWDLKKVMSIQALSDCPIKCSTETCTMAAAALYVSSSKEQWYTCLDCQETDYGGWPELADMPINYMSPEHKAALLSKCSKYKSTAMPNFPDSPNKTVTGESLPNSVTPVPHSSKTLPKQEIDGKAVITPAVKPKKKPSKEHLEMHRKWQSEAEALGGKEARIVLSKPAAKKIIFDFMFDAFRPMNITQIFQGLKAVIPRPILKACLDDMAFDSDVQFAESDDEDDTKSKKKKKSAVVGIDEHYKGALSFKQGKGASQSLYFVDYGKAKNGDGLDRDERNKLVGDVAMANAEQISLKHNIETMTTMTKKLLSEPTNEEATMKLQQDESALNELHEQVVDARELTVNEKHKEKLKRRITSLASVWRKRRRTCLDFLSTLEDITDGTVTVKKSLAGDGPLELESDVGAAKAAMEYAKAKKSGGLGRRPAAVSKKPGIQADPSFVAVHLDKQGRVHRLFVGDDIPSN